MNTHKHLHTNLSDVLTMVMIKISLQLCRDSFQIGTDHWLCSTLSRYLDRNVYGDTASIFTFLAEEDERIDVTGKDMLLLRYTHTHTHINLYIYTSGLRDAKQTVFLQASFHQCIEC